MVRTNLPFSSRTKRALRSASARTTSAVDRAGAWRLGDSRGGRRPRAPGARTAERRAARPTAGLEDARAVHPRARAELSGGEAHGASAAAETVISATSALSSFLFSTPRRRLEKGWESVRANAREMALSLRWWFA